MRATPGRSVAPSGNSASATRGTGRGGKRLRQLQSPSAVQRKRVLGQRVRRCQCDGGSGGGRKAGSQPGRQLADEHQLMAKWRARARATATSCAEMPTDYRRGYFSRSAAQLFADPFGSNRKQSRHSQKPKTMPLYNSPMDLCRDMRSLSISDISAADLSFSEKGDWDGEDGLAMQILTASWFDDLSPWNDDSGCGSSRSSSISSSCRTNSWESLSAIFTPPGPKFSFELPEISQGLDIKIDLGTSIQNFQTAVLPYGNIDMYMQNRSQYHRLAQAADKVEFKQVMCSCCSFLYTVPVEQ